MGKSYLLAIEARMSDEDKEQLKAIYQPTVVTVLPVDASRQLAVTPDGEIRLYGHEDVPEEHGGGAPYYLASCDGGLSWKKHLIKDTRVLGAAGYNPKTGRYISTDPNPYFQHSGETIQGTYIVYNDEGFDGVNNTHVKLSDLCFNCMKRPYYIEELCRWILCAEYTDEQTRIKRITVSVSDDDGVSWKTQILERYAPYYEQRPPHKGVRWQQYSCEPSFVYLGNKEILMHVRTAQDYHYEYRSYDGGDTWEGPVPTVFHGTDTMPILYKLSDGRIIHLWANARPLAELDHEKTFPPLSEAEKKGIWEDVFTNRDINCLSISEDGAKTWCHTRELWRNNARNRSDFRSVGGFNTRDKSVHQGEMLELPFGKLLVCFGQHAASRRAVILDVNWLYEKEAKEDFRFGLEGVSTHMFVKSNLGGFRTFSGHCAYNRTHGALLLPDPDGNFEEVLQLCYMDDPRLVYQKQGVVWGFPSSRRGEVKVSLRVVGEGVRISLLDAFANPVDEYVGDFAHVSVEYRDRRNEGWDELTLRFDTESGVCELLVNEKKTRTLSISSEAPLGLLYLHIQTLASTKDVQGTLIKKMEKRDL